MSSHLLSEVMHRLYLMWIIVAAMVMILFIATGCSLLPASSTARVPEKESSLPTKAPPTTIPKEEPATCRFFFGC